MGDGSLEAYGHVVSFCEDFFFAPHFPPPQGAKTPPKMPLFDQKCQKNVKKVDSGPKNGPILMGDCSLEAYGLPFFEETFFTPSRPPQGESKTPQKTKNAPLCQKMSKKFIVSAKMIQ